MQQARFWHANIQSARYLLVTLLIILVTLLIIHSTCALHVTSVITHVTLLIALVAILVTHVLHGFVGRVNSDTSLCRGDDRAGVVLGKDLFSSEADRRF